MRYLVCLSLILVVSATFALPARPQTPASVGLIKICKKDNPDDYPEPEWWRREVVVPVGVEFRDVGPIDDVAGDWIRLKVVTMQPVSLKGGTKCGVVRALIPSNQTPLELGQKPVGPIVYVIRKDAGRLLEVMSWGNSPTPPRKLAPWADVVAVEATIESDFK